MRVLVVRVRVMRVAVMQRRVVVCMGVHLAGGEDQSGLVRVIVLVVQVVAMRMAVVHGFMHMGVGVVFGQVQPQPEAHKRSRHGELPGQRLASGQAQRRTKERSQRKIRAGARRAQLPQAHHKQHQAYAVGQQSYQHGAAECR